MNIGQMTLSEFAKLEDIKKTAVVELHPRRQLNEESWTQHGSYTNTWWLNFTYGEIDRVELDGVELTEKFSISDCNGTAETWYYNPFTQNLFIHTTDSDDPATVVSSYPKYSVVVYFWVAISNRPVEVERRKQLLDDGIFNFWTTSTNAEFWTEWITGSSTVDKSTTVYDDKIEVYSAKITIDGSGNVALIRQDITTRPQAKHKIKIRYRSTGAAKVRIQDVAANVFLNSSSQWVASTVNCIDLSGTGGEFETAEIEFVTHPSYDDYRIMIRMSDASKLIYISRVEVWRYYLPLQPKCLLDLNAIPSIQQSVGVYYYPESQISFGKISIIDDGYFISNKENLLWHNIEAIVRVGDLDQDYEDFPIFFYGYTRKPIYKLGEFRLSVMDRRIELKRLPIGTFNSTDYPNVDPEWADRPVPIFLGACNSITADFPLLPVCIDTSNHKYQISEVTFRGTSYDLYAINYVLKDGKQLTITTDYTVDLPNAQFTLVDDPRDSEIVCYAEGIEISPFGNAYSLFPADALYFILCIANDINKQRLNWASFVDLNSNRQIGVNLFIDEEIDSIELIDELQRTAIFQMFVRLDGTIEARRYTSDVPADVPSFRTSDFATFPEIIEDTDHCYRGLALLYDFNNVSKVYEDEVNEDSHTYGISGVRPEYAEYEYGSKSKMTVETLATLQTQSENLWDNITKMVQGPMEMISGKLNVPEALLLNPTDKIKIHLEGTIDETKHTIYDNETFQIISITKNIANCSADIVAFKGVSTNFWTL
jgi:hypothetical protein